jgi:tetratricopeptide (TPR) repeat protein
VKNLIAEIKYLLARKKDSVLLRNLLRKNPRWLRGHLFLARFEIERQLNAEEGRDLRSLGTIEVSTQAAAKLGAYSHDLAFLTAMYNFFCSRYEQALSFFDTAIQLNKLSLEEHNLALEYAGASAMVVGNKDEAKKYFLQIPEELRNIDVQAALEMFEQSENDQ